MTTLEQLANKHEEHEFLAGIATYTFTLDQLDAYFMERLKMVVGKPVVWLADNGMYYDILDKKKGMTPLYALSVSLED